MKSTFTNILLICALTSISFSAVARDCVAPTNKPIIPDGHVASKDELLAAQDAVKAFQTRNLEFLVCLDKKREAIAPDAAGSAETLAKYQAQEEAAIALEQSVANEFNTARTNFMER
ncbi:hypothetical protein GCM10008090_26090 [Arenicella chitinivorans]|uniref:Uncharacterized protein n=1 Tax=Arenicella chitinivorans TaxID=1329800 RepID=A0A918RXP3_9GAMM|nr:hypothetical protein [Arenicella chitinivorans]GHA15315.1 hypothetical protein GCM10008090_26090 [Arenicella chitinivorans]